MFMSNLNASTLSEKVSKIRWVPEQYSAVHSFVTEDDEIEYTPKPTAKVNIVGDVTGMQFVDMDNFVVSSSAGFINLYNINRDLAANNLALKYTFDGLHKFETNNVAPCLDLSVCGNSAATVGEDGKLNIINLIGMSLIRSFDNADSCI